MSHPLPYPTDTPLPPSTAYPSSHPLSPHSMTIGPPPPPPPKPAAGFSANAGQTPSQSGPPLPAPPPIPRHPSANVAPPSSASSVERQFRAQAQDQTQYQGTNPPVPSIEEGWLPEGLRDKSKNDLEALVDPSNTALITALLNAPSTAHPSLPASRQPLEAALATNLQLATHLTTMSTTLSTLRAQLTAQLLQAHALERAWRNKQTELDKALEPWSPKAVHARLVSGIQEQEALVRGLGESFIEGGGGYGEDGGKAAEREVTEWVRRYREGVKTLALRRERRARFEEGRVGGWR